MFDIIVKIQKGERMKRSGFTMVELIFVIVIIGILAATALPKFNGVKDRAKVNSELSAMGGLDGAIVAAREGRYEDYGNGNFNWYKLSESDMNDSTSGNPRGAHFQQVNDAKTVLGGIAQKTSKLQIMGYYPLDHNGASSWNDGLYYNPIVITGPASNPTIGVKCPVDHDGQDIPGKPDKNDFWIFNPSSVDLNITNSNDPDINPVVIESGTIGLVDVNGTAPVAITNIRFTGASNTPNTLYFRNNGM